MYVVIRQLWRMGDPENRRGVLLALALIQRASGHSSQLASASAEADIDRPDVRASLADFLHNYVLGMFDELNTRLFNSQQLPDRLYALRALEGLLDVMAPRLNAFVPRVSSAHFVCLPLLR